MVTGIQETGALIIQIYSEVVTSQVIMTCYCTLPYTTNNLSEQTLEEESDYSVDFN